MSDTPPQKPKRTRRRRDLRSRVMELAELIALSRGVRPAYDPARGGMVAEKIPGAQTDVTPDDVLRAERFLGWYATRPMA